MTVEVALAMLHQEDRWLLQLRDENPGIVAPGCWGLFGGHLEHGETALVALRRELNEEIGWCPNQLNSWFQHQDEKRIVHVFTGKLSVPLQDLRLLHLSPWKEVQVLRLSLHLPSTSLSAYFDVQENLPL